MDIGERSYSSFSGSCLNVINADGLETHLHTGGENCDWDGSRRLSEPTEIGHWWCGLGNYTQLGGIYPHGGWEETHAKVGEQPTQMVMHATAFEPIVDVAGNEMVNPPLTKRKRKLVSKVWEVFTTKEIDGKEWAICKYCNKKYARSSRKETSNLLKHMDKCRPNPINEDLERLAEVTNNITAPHVVNSNKIASQKEWNRLDVARMIIRHRCPWSMIEQDNSRTFPNILKADILHVYKEEQEKFCRSLAEISGRFSLTFNFLGLRNFCLITIHFIDNCWQLKRKILALKKLDFWGYWKSFKDFKSVLLDWNIDNKLCCLTAQNMEEADKIVKEIKLWLTYQGSVFLEGKVLHCGCFTHILDLLVEEGLLEVKDVFMKILNCNSYIFSKPDNDRKFRIAVDHARSEGKKVISEEIPASSTCSIELLEKALGYREAFHFLQEVDPDFSLNPLAEEWDKITRVYECLKVLTEVIHSISGNRCLTTNVFFPKVCSIHRSLSQWVKGGTSDIRLMAARLKSKFGMYWSKCHLVLAIAAILDPRFKFGIVESWYREIYGQDAEMQWKSIRDTLEEVYKEYENSTSSADANYNMLDHQGMPLTSSQGSSDSGNSQISELKRYLEEPKFRSVDKFDILGWWRVNTPNFPTLAKMARDFLAIPMSTAFANPTFVASVLKIDPISFDLDSDVMEALICVPDWLHMPERNLCIDLCGLLTT